MLHTQRNSSHGVNKESEADVHLGDRGPRRGSVHSSCLLRSCWALGTLTKLLGKEKKDALAKFNAVEASNDITRGSADLVALSLVMDTRSGRHHCPGGITTAYVEHVAPVQRRHKQRMFRERLRLRSAVVVPPENHRGSSHASVRGLQQLPGLAVSPLAVAESRLSRMA